MRIQLWSYNYEPEPTGIAPISARWAVAMSERGHDVDVVAAHPHYPKPIWGTSRRPYRERRDGIDVLRLPLAVGRASAAQRIRQEASFALSLTAASAFVRRPDVVVAVSPSFPALLPAVLFSRIRRVPLVVVLKDLLPDGAVATGLMSPDSKIVKASHALERLAYGTAKTVVVISQSFARNLMGKGVPERKIELIYDPASRPITPRTQPEDGSGPPKVLSMGNIGFSQGLAPLVAAFERSDEMRERGVQLVITGDGVAAPAVRDEVGSDRVSMPGLVDDERLEEELRSATLAVVTQQYEGTEFNLPSKLMNFMAYGIPVLAAVNPEGEVAQLVREADCGWVADSSVPDSFPAAIAAALDQPEERERLGANGQAFAREHFSVEGCARRFERVLAATVNGHEATGAAI